MLLHPQLHLVLRDVRVMGRIGWGMEEKSMSASPCKTKFSRLFLSRKGPHLQPPMVIRGHHGPKLSSI